jgi:sialic acid synthase SpsE
MAKRLIDVAADAVKFQTYSVETLYSNEALVLPIKGTGW